MDKFQFNDMLKEVRVQFFASKYATVKQFAQYSGLWPSEFDPNKVPHWNNEKKAFLEKEISKDTALGASYQQNLKEIGFNQSTYGCFTGISERGIYH